MLERIDGRSFGGFCWKELPRRNGSRKKEILVSRRIATDSPKLITVVGSGAGVCCGKMSCGYCHQSMHHFVHHGQPLILTSLFKSSPAKSGEHGGDTAVVTIVITDHPGGTSIDSFDFVFLFDGVWIPDDRTILHR